MSEWISIKNALPEDCVNVLVCGTDGRRIFIAIAYYLSDLWWGGIWVERGQTDPHIDGVHDNYQVPDMPSSCITHWQPLPENIHEDE